MNTRIVSFALLLIAAWHASAASPATISAPSQPSLSAAGGSYTPIFSADGKHVVFVSQAHNLVTNDRPSMRLDIFLRDLVSSNTVLVSVNTNGIGGSDADANYVSVSSNGQFVAFVTRGATLVAVDTNQSEDVFVRDVVNGVTRLVSVDVTGRSPIETASAANVGLSENPMISGDGRWVFFQSRATNLISPPAPLSGVNVYARDLWSNTTVLVSANMNGTAVTGRCDLVQITSDGRFALFTTSNANMVSGTSTQTVYLRDVTAGQTIWAATNHVSVASPVMDSSARFIAFVDLVPTQYPSAPYGTVLRFDRLTGASDSIGIATNVEHGIHISADGLVIGFDQPVSGNSQAVRWTEGHGLDVLPGDSVADVSADGTTTVTISNAQILVTSAGTTRVVTANTAGASPNSVHDDSQIAVNADGSMIAFESDATDLVAGDFNKSSDVFLYRDAAPSLELISQPHSARIPAAGMSLASTAPRSISADGHYAVFLRLDEPSTFRDTNSWSDLYIADLLTGGSRVVTVDTNVYLGGGSPIYSGNTNRFDSPAISADGSVIVAVATNFANGFRRIVFCGPGGATTFLRNAAGQPASSEAPSLSADGHLLLFQSTAADIVSPNISLDHNGTSPDIFVRYERVTDTNVTVSNYLVSGYTAFDSGNGASINPILSANARWAVFATKASDIIAGVSNALSTFQIVAADLGSDASSSNYLVNPPKRLVSYDANHQPLGVDATNAVISSDSRFVIFATSSGAIYRHDLLSTPRINDLVCTNGRNPSVSADGSVIAYERVRAGTNIIDLFATDLRDGRESLLSANMAGLPGNGSSTSPLVSADGRYAVFQSKAGDLVLNDTNHFTDIFVRDRLLGATALISGNGLASGNGPSTRPVLGPDGRTLLFQSFASDLAPGDYNGLRDVFVLKLGGADSDGDGLDDDWEVAYFGNLSRDGSGDFDGDGVTDRDEFLAGTDPTNGGSVFRVLTVAPLGGSSKRLIWTGNPARNYRIEYKDDLNAASWLSLNGTLSWNGETATVTDSSGSSNRFYRIVRLP